MNETILDSMDRIGQSLDYFTERINRVKIVPLSAKECQVVPSRVPHGTPLVPNDTKVPIWETLGLSRRTYFRRKSKGMI